MFSYNEHYSGIVNHLQQKIVIRNPGISLLFLLVLHNTIDNIENTLSEMSNYSSDFKLNIKEENLNNELSSLKEEKKDKLWEYNRWIKWNQEMLEKIK